MNELTVNFKKVREDAIIPSKKLENDAGLDLYACIDKPIVIHGGCTDMIPTGIAIEIPDGYFGGIFARSGLSTKEDLAPATKVSVIDSTYRGEIFVPLHNHGNQNRVIKKGERISQLIILPYLNCKLNEVNELNETDRGENGFGSTGE